MTHNQMLTMYILHDLEENNKVSLLKLIIKLYILWSIKEILSVKTNARSNKNRQINIIIVFFLFIFHLLYSKKMFYFAYCKNDGITFGHGNSFKYGFSSNGKRRYKSRY